MEEQIDGAYQQITTAVDQTARQPNPEEAPAIPFDGSNSTGRWWQDMLDEGAVKLGFFLIRFQYLFGKHLPELQPCLNSWSFLLQKDKQLYVFGKKRLRRVARGRGTEWREPANDCRTTRSDAAEYLRDDGLAFGNMLGWWIPNKKLPLPRHAVLRRVSGKVERADGSG